MSYEEALARLKTRKGPSRAVSKGSKGIFDTSDPTPQPAFQDREIAEAIREQLAERAAIQEFDGELPREQAEQEAKKALRVFEYQIADSPSWLFMLAPNYTLEQAERSLRLRFGDRLVAVRRYEP